MASPSLSSIPCYQDCVSRYQGMADRKPLYMCELGTNWASSLTRRTFLNYFQIDKLPNQYPENFSDLEVSYLCMFLRPSFVFFMLERTLFG